MGVGGKEECRAKQKKRKNQALFFMCHRDPWPLQPVLKPSYTALKIEVVCPLIQRSTI
jgi:hypothetical protein